MNDMEVLQKQLIRDEGNVLSAYQDSLGFWTIGVGRLIDARKSGGITLEESMILLKNDILKHTQAVVNHLPWADPGVIGSARFGALINMHFQLGNYLWQFEKTLKLMEAHKWSKAADEMLKSQWASQTPERAKRIARQIKEGVWV